ncbi:hypothetical protein ES703_71031 [subsurface metagenome]
MTFSFVCCPKCKEVIHLERIGSAGVKGVKDSKLIKCESCGHIFRTSGNTWREEHGHLED